MYYDPGTGKHVMVDGNIVERDALRIAEAIRDYDDRLVLLCLDPNRAEGISEAPFIVAEKCNDGVMRPVMRAWHLDDLLLERIRLSDTRFYNTLDTIEKIEKQQRQESQRRYREWREEADGIAQAILTTNKSSYTVRDSNTGDMLTFYDDRPAKRERVES